MARNNQFSSHLPAEQCAHPDHRHRSNRQGRPGIHPTRNPSDTGL